MSNRTRATRDGSRAAAVVAYKQILRDVLDRRPSGTRHRLAQALGKARSFVSQLTNPAYAIAIPAPHLAVIFEVCHLSQGERERFLSAYALAHPRRVVPADGPPRLRSLHLLVPDLGSEKANRALDHLINDYTQSLAKVVTASKRGDPPKGSTS